MSWRRSRSEPLVFAVWMLAVATVHAADLDADLNTVLKVDKNGVGHREAADAVLRIEQKSTATILPLLSAMDDANPIAANWLQGAFETIAERTLNSDESLPVEELDAFAADRSHASQPRRLAFDWLVRVDHSAAERLIPGMIDDPSQEFRREAVQRLLDQAAAVEAGQDRDEAETKSLYEQAYKSALDPDQLDLAFDKLTALGEKPNLKQQLGLLDKWWIVTPFDHKGGIGFDKVYPPEMEIDLTTKYAGATGELTWIQKQSDQRHAIVDLNKLIAPHKGAVAYAFCEFPSEREQSVDIRLGTPNGWKLWVNDELLFAHEEYHQTMRMDQYRVAAKFKSGVNRILLKICQNEQTEDWAQRWEFQLRVCDAAGAAVLPSNSPQTAATAPLSEATPR